jgi:hypothetical protein
MQNLPSRVSGALIALVMVASFAGELTRFSMSAPTSMNAPREQATAFIVPALTLKVPFSD